MSSISISIFLLILASSTLFNPTSAANCHADDEAGLLAFKYAITADPSGLLSSWKRGTACCTWSGVTCLTGNRVTSLSLYGQPDNPKSFLSGTISPSLSNLTFLDSIYLVNTRNLSGPFPTFFFHLPKFLYIYIENNKLSGPLPANIGDLKNLRALSLVGNRFSGNIPSSISKLTGLSQLRLGGNLFTGPIPDGIRRFKDLVSLDLSRNQLSGPIPDIFGALLNLRSLDLTHNKLTGQIPASISALAPILMFLELGHNSLTGKIPTFLANFQSLDTLDLGSNRFSGVVPKSFVNLTKIFNLDLSHNLLTDPFPALKVKGIESLDLSYNSFHLGTIPKWVTSSPIIYSLKLAKCGIKIKLDDWKPTQTYFYDYIDLSENNVSGSPIGLLNRTEYLVSFRAAGTQLKFNMSRLIFPKTLKDLDISRALVFGSVPPAITQLKTFNVSHNQQICGRLPPNNFTADSFAGDGCLCGAPLFPCCPRCG